MIVGTWALALISCAGFVGIVVLAIVLPRRGVTFWPPPSPRNWQSRCFRWLFRLGVGGLIALSVLLLWQGSVVAPFELQGILVWALGFGMAFRITRQMGWKRAFGDTGGLITNGWFARSRNPVYVASWLGMSGWALFLPDIRVLLPLASWALMYFLAPRWEEPWLRQQYGAAFDAYAAETPRFF